MRIIFQIFTDFSEMKKGERIFPFAFRFFSSKFSQ